MNQKMKIILITSLILNVLLIGFSLSQMNKMRPESMWHHKEEKIVKSLPASKQELAKETFARLKEIREKNNEAIKKQFKNLEAVATEEIFDEKKFLTEFENYEKNSNEIKKESSVEIAKFLSQLNLEERRKLVDNVKKHHLHHWM